MVNDRPAMGLARFALATIAIGTSACTGSAPLPSEAPDATPMEAAGDMAPGGRAMMMRLTVELQGPVASPDPACTVAQRSSVLEGYATHLGQFHGTGSTCIMSAAPDPNPPFLPPGPPPYVTAQFTNPRWVLIAANGDELWLEGYDAVAVLSLNPATGAETSLRAQGKHRIIGGTGRFAGATGELETTAVNEDGQGADEATSVGWIRY